MACTRPAEGPAKPGLHPEAREPRQGATGRDDHRAASKVRRTAAANDLGRLLTLTFAREPTSVAELNAAYRNFRRRARRRLPRVAMLKVNERGKKGRLHMHVAVSGATHLYAPSVVWQELWPLGFVKITRKTADPRRAGRYLAKYVSKDPVRVPGGHRYEVDEGLQADEWTVDLPYAPNVALGVVLDALGVKPERAWLSGTIEGWSGPDAAGAFW